MGRDSRGEWVREGIFAPAAGGILAPVVGGRFDRGEDAPMEQEQPTDFEISVGSPAPYERIVAEVACTGGTCFIVNEEAGIGSYEIELIPQSNGQPWKFSVVEFRRAIDDAVRQLRRLGPELRDL